jgi:hypothetical protein
MADAFPAFTAVFAMAGLGAESAGRLRSGRGVQRPLGLKRTRPDAGHRGGQQKCQAGDSRIAEQDGPHRKRQREGHGHRPHSDRRGHQNHPCNHLAHPPRVSHPKRVGGPWQDYGRALVNLRPVDRGTARVPQRRGKQPFSEGLRRVFARGLICVGGCIGIASKPLPAMGISCVGRGVQPDLLAAGHEGFGAWPRAAATCRNVKRCRGGANPDVAEECLSFVIPGQQARPGKRGEVH